MNVKPKKIKLAALALVCALCSSCIQNEDDTGAFGPTEESRALSILLNPNRNNTPLPPGGIETNASKIVLPDITIRPSNPRGDDDQDLLDNGFEDFLIRKFAPNYYLHSREPAKMSGVDWVLARSSGMFFSKKHGPLSYLFPQPTRVTMNNLGDYRFSIFGKTYSSDQYYDVKNDGAFVFGFNNTQVRAGNMVSSRCYALARISSVPGVHYEIQYWWFYPYNPGRTIFNAGSHSGDWEHVIVQVRQNRSLHSVKYYAHGSPKTYYPHALILDAATRSRPRVFSAFESHASYPKTGTHFYAGPVYDRTNYGDHVDCARRFVNIGNRAYPSRNNGWIKFRGKWGNKDGAQAANHENWSRRDWNREGRVSMPSTTAFQNAQSSPKRIKASVSSLATKALGFRLTNATVSGVSGASIRILSSNRAEVYVPNRHNRGRSTATVRLTYSAGGKSFTRTGRMTVIYSSSSSGGGGPIDRDDDCNRLEGPCLAR